MRRAIGYVRLSREDERGPGSMAEKFEVRRRIVRDLAQRHDVQLDDADIYTEQASGATIAARPVVQQILAMCREGNVSALVTPYQDRLTRGSAAEWESVQADLTVGRVALVTTDGVTDYGDDDIDELGGDLRALIARQELRTYGKRRRQTNIAKARSGARYGGFAPYGYRWIRDQYDQRTGDRIETAHYEVIDDEYAVVCEIWRRIREQGMKGICYDLNRRVQATGAPLPPGAARNYPDTRVWTPYTVQKILRNPIYAGYPAKRHLMVRGHRRVLDRSEWIMAEAEGDYPHPVTLVEFERVQALLHDRLGGRNNPHTATLLCGLLWCPQGQQMGAGGQDSYSCKCGISGTPHPHMSIGRTPAERMAIDVVCRVLTTWPEEDAPRVGQPSEAAQAALDLHAANRRLNEARSAVDDLQRHIGAWVRAWGEAGYEEAARRAIEQVTIAQAEVNRLTAVVTDTAAEDTRTIARAVREVGWEAVWDEASRHEQRAILASVIARIEPVPIKRRWLKEARIQLRDHVLHHPQERVIELNDYRYTREPPSTS